MVNLKTLMYVLMALLFCACKKYDTKVSTNPLPEMKATFSANIDGMRVTWKADSAGFTSNSFVYIENNATDSSFNSYICSIQKSNRNSIEFVRERLGYLGNSPSQFDFKNFFLPGNYSYAFTATNPRSGFTINYYEGGAKYSTRGFTSNQSPGGFRIVSLVDGVNASGEYQVNVICTFNCILYDVTSSTSTKRATQGQFSGSFVYK